MKKVTYVHNFFSISSFVEEMRGRAPLLGYAFSILGVWMDGEGSYMIDDFFKIYLKIIKK